MTHGALAMVAQDAVCKPTANDTWGGSSETEAREVAHRPTGASSPAVMTATPLA
ncbi:hypothetical protein QFZ49_005587 [Streptomyces turgidiscabies]|uniref:Uncharacterized protein n=1 Tax=Streptomyces turgidiscabies TaxID=85558 RepID=A0ABU0RUH1_9ACTN|nr:hypothetical protein [Streptomyces turgidiscabies]